MKRMLVLIVFVISAVPVYADWLHKLVGYDCDEIRDAIILTYRGAYNEAGEAMMANKGPHEWDPWSLVAKMKDDDHIDSLKTAEGECRLSDGVYKITIGPTPGNFNIQGICGGWMTAWAEVRRGSELILPHYDFEDDCLSMKASVTTEVVIKAGNKRPIIKTVSGNEFGQLPRIRR
jgi:hypothetical protein